MSARETRAGRLVRQLFDRNYEVFVICIFLGGAASIPIAAIIFALVVNGGRTSLPFPTYLPHFVPGPKGRGTMGLIFVCMSTIFTCVYVSVHGDVPDISKAKRFAEKLIGGGATNESGPAGTTGPQEQSSTAGPQGPHGRAKQRVRAFVAALVLSAYTFIEKPVCKRVLFMMANIFGPEFIVLVAMLELISAYDGLRYMRRCGQKKWFITLAFFADMGGFELDNTEHTHFHDGRSFLAWFRKLREDYGGNLELAADEIKLEVDDRSKANIVLKIFTLIQAGWLFIVTIARFTHQKDVSTLEVTTCSYIFCTAFTYIFWMYKPYNVGTRVILRKSHFRPEPETFPITKPTAEDGGKLSDAAPEEKRDNIVPATRPHSTARDSSHFRSSSSSTSALPTLLRSSEGTTNTSDPDTEAARGCPNPDTLPTMIYTGATFTPFNRSYLHPELSWLSMSHPLHYWTCKTKYSPLFPYSGLRRLGNAWCPCWSCSCNSFLEHVLDHFNRAGVVACVLHRASYASSVRRLHRTHRVDLRRYTTFLRDGRHGARV